MLSGNLSLVLSLVPENVANQFKQTDDANNALVEMETIALDSCLSGNYSIGRNVLASAEYAANKTIYSNGLQYVKAYIGQTEQTTQNVQAALVLLLSLIMLIIGLLVVATYYLQRRSAKYIEREKEQADALLGSILPENIVDRLKQGETKIADSHQDVALMFSDIVGFTPLSSVMSVGEIVELLNQIFCAFDKYAKQFNIEKIKTVSFNRITDKKIGDGYMCVDFSCNVENMVRFANKCLKHVKMLNEKLKLPAALNIRIGMHTGPAISGIIGQSKIAFDVWGDSVNVASRMESASEPGHLQLSAAAYAKVSYCSDLQFVEREIYVKGKGQQQAYLLMHEAAWSPMSEFDSEADFLLNSKK
jgi:class 3 adenylate cyclase